jgi:hypothetical protein
MDEKKSDDSDEVALFKKMGKVKSKELIKYLSAQVIKFSFVDENKRNFYMYKLKTLYNPYEDFFGEKAF